ncbi:MAG: hypothetical protein IT305_05275 [Chloroflexi bacterium]|nr:hypothetical protein [Chloroflexota bacterium]
MGLWDTLKSALGFGGGSGDVDRGLYLYVRCDRCQDIVRVRINMANDLRQEFDNSENVAGYALSKTVVDSKCFRPMALEMRFDSRRRELERTIDGGEFVTEADWLAARIARQNPPT